MTQRLIGGVVVAALIAAAGLYLFVFARIFPPEERSTPPAPPAPPPGSNAFPTPTPEAANERGKPSTTTNGPSTSQTPPSGTRPVTVPPSPAEPTSSDVDARLPEAPNPPFSKDESTNPEFSHRSGRVDFLIESYYGYNTKMIDLFTNKNVTLRFSCPYYGAMSSEYWMAYTINIKSKPDWHLVEYYSDGSKSGKLYSRIVPTTNYPSKDRELLTAYQTDLRPIMLQRKSIYLTRIDIISNKPNADEFTRWIFDGNKVVASVLISRTIANEIFGCMLKGMMR